MSMSASLSHDGEQFETLHRATRASSEFMLREGDVLKAFCSTNDDESSEVHFLYALLYSFISVASIRDRHCILSLSQISTDHVY